MSHTPCKNCYFEAQKTANVVCNHLDPRTRPSMLFDRGNYTTNLKDGSTVLQLANRTADTFYNHDDEWSEVYGISIHTDLNPIAGTYYNTGSGEFTIVNDDGIYDYSISYERSTLVRYQACSVLMICKVKQSNIPHIDDYITYIRVVKL